MEEQWKDITGYEGIYQISNFGRVKSLARYTIQKHYLEEKILNQHENKKIDGYMVVDLYKDGKRKKFYVHRLVAQEFIGNIPEGYEIDHKDINKKNNNVNNLKIVTHKENQNNILSIERERKSQTGKKMSKESIEKLSKKVSVYKNNELLHIFNSYKDLTKRSKDILGVKLWDLYARKVVNGEMENYHGFTFKLFNDCEVE